MPSLLPQHPCQPGQPAPFLVDVHDMAKSWRHLLLCLSHSTHHPQGSNSTGSPKVPAPVFIITWYPLTELPHHIRPCDSCLIIHDHMTLVPSYMTTILFFHHIWSCYSWPTIHDHVTLASSYMTTGLLSHPTWSHYSCPIIHDHITLVLSYMTMWLISSYMKLLLSHHTWPCYSCPIIYDHITLVPPYMTTLIWSHHTWPHYSSHHTWPHFLSLACFYCSTESVGLLYYS